MVSIEVDPTLKEDQILEGLSREVMRKIQQARKNADLKLDARIELSLFIDGKLLEAVQTHEKTLKEETLTVSLTYAASADAVKGTHTEIVTDVEEGKIAIGLTVKG
jgi:isoleucyl-tRNA synthetase